MSQLKKFIDYLGGRKMFIFFIMLTISTAMFSAPMLYEGATKVTFEEWSDFAIWLIGLTVAGNFGEHAAKAYRDKKS